MTTNTTSTVFLVDDDESVRTSLSRALKKRGFPVLTFESALRFLDEYDPDLPGCLVLDYELPGLDGLELQKRLVKDGVAIPIIFISGHGGVPESVQAMKAGAVDFLEKPFRQHLLVECIETAFAKDLANRASEETRRAARAKYDQLTAREKEIAQFMIANPSNPSVRFTALAAPTITMIAKGTKMKPRLISTSLNTGSASLYCSASGWYCAAQYPAIPAIKNPSNNRILPDTPDVVCLLTLA